MESILREEVIVVSSPISERMWYKGQEAILERENKQIRVGANWFAFDDRWTVEQKPLVLKYKK